MDREKSPLGFQRCLSLLKTLARVSFVTALTLGTFDLPAQAGFLEKWRFDASTNQLEITLKEGTTPRYFLLAEPLRIILDLPNTTLGNIETQHSYSGAVRQIRVAQFQPNVTRIVLELSPSVVLKPEQVQLQAVAASGNRWVLRPLIAGFQTPTAAASPSSLPPAAFTQTGALTVKVPPLNRPQAPASSTPIPVANNSANRSSKVERLQVTSLQTQQRTVRVPTTQSPNSQTLTSAAVPEIEYGQPLLPVQNQEGQVNPIADTPPLQNGVRASDGGKPEQNLPAETQAISATSATPTVTVPPLNSSTAAKPTDNNRAVEPDVLLSAGTVLTLRYPGEKAITLQPGSPLPEVLLLKEAIRDRSGNIIAPVGTPVIGRFETDRNSSRFISQAIILGGRSIPMSAQSVPLPRNRQALQQVEPNQILAVQLKEDVR